MSYYSAFYGRWSDNTMTHIEFGLDIGIKYLYKTDDRKAAYKAAQDAANKSGEVVTMIIEKPTGSGLAMSTDKIYPKEA